MKTIESLKIAYVHARPHGHPIHEAYANSLNPDRYFIDFILRWHDQQRPALVRYLSWIMCALFFPNKGKYDVFYADGPVHFLALMKYLGLISKRQKIFFLMADETLYFIENKYYGKMAEKTLKWVIGQADGLICIGNQQQSLATSLFPSIHNVVVYNAVQDNQFSLLKKFQPSFEAKNIISICNVNDSDVRCFYKGLDLMIEQMDKVLDRLPAYNYVIYGSVSQRIQKKLLSNVKHKGRIFFKGTFQSLITPLSDAKLCLHLSRGDAYPTSTLECSLAGVPVLVSEETGTSRILREINSFCVFNKADLQPHLAYFMQLDAAACARYAADAKSVLEQYTSDKCLESYLKSFEVLMERTELERPSPRTL